MSLISGIKTVLRRGLARNIVALLFLFGIIPLGVLTLIFFSFYFEGQKQGISNVQREIAERISSGISAYLEKTTGQIQLFAHLSNLEDQDKRGFKDLAYGLLDQGLEYDIITIADLEGNEVCKVSRYYTFRPYELGSIALDESFRVALEGKMHISQIQISKFSKFPQVRITAPIIDVRDRITGVLDVGVNVARMWELISRYRIGENRYAYIVDPKGTLIVYQDISSVLQKKDLKGIQGVKNFLDGNIGVFEYEGLNNDRVIGANAIIPLTGWGIIVEQPVKAAYHDLYVLSTIFLGIFLITVVFAIFLGLRFSVRSIIGPIRRLQQEAQVIAKGEFGRKIDMNRSDELGQLSESLNRMVKDLQETTVSRDLLIQEIEERKRTEEALRESEERYRSLSEVTVEGIAFHDKGVLVDINTAFTKIFGYEVEELIGKNAIDIVVLPEYRDVIYEKVATHFNKPYEIMAQRKDGTIFPLEIEAREAHYKGNILRVASLRDISAHKKAEEEQKKLEAQLQRAQKMEALGTLAGGVAHDLNNILSGLVSYPELLLLEIPEDSPLRNPILTMQRSGEKAAAIVQYLLTLARRGVAVTEVVNLNQTISEYLKSPEHEKLKSFHPHIKAETNLEIDLLNILGSPVHLSKTIMNLVSNAAEAMPDGGKISISTENRYIDIPIRGYDHVEEGDYVVLTVSDTGVGISSADMQRIFEPFYTKKVMARSGTGLGLAVVWGTVKDHKGYVDLQSAKGKGTTFTLYFPGSREELTKDKSLVSIQDYMGKGESVLVVDDVEEQREIASRILKKLGYSVTTVSSGEEAVDYLKDNSADLLVLDMIMDPGIDGLETYKMILEFYPNQKAIIVSGFSETKRVKEAQSLGAGAYVKKPFLLQRIGLAVRDELGK